MALKLELSDERLLGELMNALARHGCLADRVAPLELRFFVRAWQANHPGVQAVLSR